MTQTPAVARAAVWVEGLVQGVGFRWWVARQAARLGLVGSVENLRDGRVFVDAQGDPADVATMVETLTGRPGPASRPGHVAQWLVEKRTVDAALVSFDIH